MRKRAHHRELQLSNYHVCNFQFKTYFGSCGFFFGGGGGDGGSSECQAARGVFFFFIPLCINFWCFKRCFALEKMSDNNQTDLKMINVSNRSVSCRKITEKVDKSFCRGDFSLCPAENLFLARKAKKCQKNMPAKFQCCAIFVPGVYSKRRSLNDDGQTNFFSKSLLSRPPQSLAVAMDLWHAHAIRWQFSCSQRKTLATCHSRRVSPRRGPVYDQDVDVHIGRKTVFPMSKALVTSFLAISSDMILLSSLLSAYTKNSDSFEAKSNFHTFSSHMWKMSPFEELVPTIKVRQRFYFR